MKRFVIFAGMMLGAALGLTNCQTEEFAAPERFAAKGKFTISIAADQVKTSNDGLRTLWVLGDKVTTFYKAVSADSTVWHKNSAFQVNEEAVGTSNGDFTGDLVTALDPGTNYNWCVIYPSKPNMTQPDGTSVNQPLGRVRQVQAGNSSSAHLSGTDFNMVGVAKNVPAGETPKVTLTHICAVMKVTVRNATAEPIRVHRVEFMAGQVIVGNYCTDFREEQLVFNPVETSLSKSTSLVVSGGAELAADAEADFYLACKPFTAAVGDTLTLRINGQEKKKILTEAFTVQSGHMKNMSFAYDAPSVDLSGDYFIAADDLGNLVAANGTPLGCGAYDGSPNTHPVLFGKKIRLEGNTVFHDDDMTIISPTTGTEIPCEDLNDFKFTLKKQTEGIYAGMYTIRAWNGYITTTSNTDKRAVDCVAEPTMDSYFDITPNGEDGTYLIVATKSMMNRHLIYNRNNGNMGRFTFGMDSDVYDFVRLIPWGTPEVDMVPRITNAGDVSVSFAGETGDKAHHIALENNDYGWEMTVDGFTGCVTDAIIYDTDFFLTVAPNESKEDQQTGSVTLKLTDPTGAHAPVVAVYNITQGRKPAKSFVKVTAARDSWVGDYLIVYDGDENPLALSMGWTTNAQQDNGNITVPVEIAGNAIPATDELLAVRALIRNNPGTQTPANAIPGSYSIWTVDATDDDGSVIPDKAQSQLTTGVGHSLGAKAKNCTAALGFNSNVDNRFYQEISYDTTNNCIQIKNTPDNKNVNSTGYWRFNSAERRFGIGVENYINANTDIIKNIQLYRLED